MTENLTLKSISELLQEKSFYIPSYQRGYRWTKQQVEDLLNDIWEFYQDVELEKTKTFYCLQPIVIKKSSNPNYKWDVIDGQQRLTTILIILKTALVFLEEDGLEPYRIGYETRIQSEDFLDNKLDVIDCSNIDFFHMSKAYETIINWFKEENVKKSDFIKLLLKDPIIENNIDKAKNIRVIWYEVQDNENEGIKRDIDIFTRINMGKIPLTNAELLKAVLLEGFKDKNQSDSQQSNSKQFEIASQWDEIEYTLQHDDFWLFINKEKNQQATRIEFIFELIGENYLKDKQEFKATLNKSIDDFYIFHVINHFLKNDTRSADDKQRESIYENLWKQVKDYYRILNEWYENRELFHKIGFLVIYNTSKKQNKKSVLSILDLIAKYIKEDSTKEEFIKFLNLKIRKQFENIDIRNLKYDKHEDKIRKVLLMFNIQTIINNKNSNMRFQFDRLKNEEWDIEHIRSQNDKFPSTTEDKRKWFKDVKDSLSSAEFEQLLNNENTNEEDLIKKENSSQFVALYKKVQEMFEGSDSFDKHVIGNLALLDAGTNRGYGNAFFPIKRKTILANDMKGTFIPICTKNVFMKYYTENVSDISMWTKDDADDYRDKIIETLILYMNEEV